MTKLKSIRKQKKLTQQEVADRIGVSLRSYISYENDESKVGSLKYNFLLKELEGLNPLDEEHGILTIEEIKDSCAKVLKNYSVQYAILFGSYANETPTEVSDVDLVVSGGVTGLKFYEMVECLREKLHKNVDVLDIKQLVNNEELLDEVLRGGKRIYGQQEK